MKTSLGTYPEGRPERDSWIAERRGERNAVDASRPYAFFVEDECSEGGEIVAVATIFLTNRECPWRCLMCDLWKNTTAKTVPVGAIPGQIDYALGRLGAARQVKLYNSGSFFDARAIPLEDYAAVAQRVAAFERVIVESHPLLVGANCFRFKELVSGRLEVAMGLETAHPEALERLNKGMTLEQFACAAKQLRERNIDLRVFILVKPPFMHEDEALVWARRSIDFAFDCGATAVSLIPTRGGNGALEELAASGSFSPPLLETLESAVEYGLSLRRGRVFADVWDLSKLDLCRSCGDARASRLRAMNLSQGIMARLSCDDCGGDN
jgi:radical SAM enzyme (TIGR01210 family)